MEVAAKELNEEQDLHVINSDHRFQSDFYHVHSLSGAQEVTVRLLLIPTTYDDDRVQPLIQHRTQWIAACHFFSAEGREEQLPPFSAIAAPD